MSKRDYIYYDFRFDNIKPKKKLWLLYCIIRKFITIYESPSRVYIWSSSKGKIGM